jgi:hypothetical protein
MLEVLALAVEHLFPVVHAVFLPITSKVYRSTEYD